MDLYDFFSIVYVVFFLDILSYFVILDAVRKFKDHSNLKIRNKKNKKSLFPHVIRILHLIGKE